MIYCGYQGIGKSTLGGKFNIIDLESGNFWVNSVRVNEWYAIYANMAQHLSNQGFIVFTASHKIFRDYLNEQGIEFTTISPSVDLKDEWIKRLEERYNMTKLDKDYKALMNAKEKYEENVLDLQSEKNALIINRMDYSLLDMLIKNKKS